MRLSLLLLSTVLAGSTAISQQTLPGAHPSASLQPATASNAQLQSGKPSACPLGLNFRFASVAVLNNADQWHQPIKPEQRIDIDMRNLEPVEIVDVEGHVQAIPDAPRVKLLAGSMIPTAQALPAPAPFQTDNKMQAYSEVSLRWTLSNATGVEWVQVDRISYADGQVWRRHGADVCKVTVGMMLVN